MSEWRFHKRMDGSSASGGGVEAKLVRAPNPGPMTAEGTNTYVLRGLRGGPAAVIDPGPDIPAHREAVIAEAGGLGKIAVIVVTHTHVDHSGGAPALQRATGALTYGFGPHGAGVSPQMRELATRLSANGVELGGGEGADRDFTPQRLLADGQFVGAAGARWRLTALHTPGHTSNHLCLVVEDAAGRPLGAVFSGDHVMGWATSLVSPPDGDMAAYLASLDKLGAREEPLLLPGHGAPVENARERIGQLRTHRAQRRAAILACLESGAKTPEEIRALVYEGLQPGLEPMADRNVLAHLLELVAARQVSAFPAPAPTAQFRRI